MKPVALSAYMTDAQIYTGLFECDILEHVGYNEEMLKAVRKLIDSAIPPGYVVVPVEPTKAMETAGWNVFAGCGRLAMAYKAMITVVQGEQ